MAGRRKLALQTSYVREYNIKLITSCLYQEPLSCMELSKKIGISDVGIRKIIKELEGKNIVRKNITNEDGSTGFKIVCNKCNEKDIEQKKKEDKLFGISQRIKSFIWSGIFAAIILASGIYYLTTVGTPDGIDIGMVILFPLCTFTFSSCMFLKNNFIEDLFLDIASWGFVTFPGLIFDLSFDGIVWLIGMKIIFWLLGFVLGFLATLLALFVCLGLSLFAYPFAIARSFRHPELSEDI